MMQWRFPTTRSSRSPLTQMVAGVIGVVVVMTVGLFALGAAAIIVVGLVIAFSVRRLLSGNSIKPMHPDRSAARVENAAQGNVIDGEYVVVAADRAKAGRYDADRDHRDRRA